MLLTMDKTEFLMKPPPRVRRNFKSIFLFQDPEVCSSFLGKYGSLENAHFLKYSYIPLNEQTEKPKNSRLTQKWKVQTQQRFLSILFTEISPVYKPSACLVGRANVQRLLVEQKELIRLSRLLL